MGRFNSFEHSSSAQINSQLNSISLDHTQSDSIVDTELIDQGLVTESPAIIPDLICFSHLRWDFVYQRPQHLLSRSARECRVFFVEEPIYSSMDAEIEITRRDCGVYVVQPRLPSNLSEDESNAILQAMVIDNLIIDYNITEYVLWYYTPMARAFTEHLEPLAIIYDCMDELSAFKNPPKGLKERESELLKAADLVFTGGLSLYEAKRHLHHNVHAFPSSIDANHFRKARHWLPEPPEQASIPHPRLGFFGVIDERFDVELLDGLAKNRPDWHFVIVGPIVKIDPEELPNRPNIHFTGAKPYQELPNYLSSWDLAMLPFARNDSTRFISPTKTPEYLAAGIPVVSTSIQDVVRPYGQQGLVRIADTVEDFLKAATFLMSTQFNRTAWLQQIDNALLNNSWDRTWNLMSNLVNSVLKRRFPESTQHSLSPVPEGNPLSQVSSQTSSLKAIAVSPALGD